MNSDTREIRDLLDITPREMATGKWIKIPKGYVPKVPVTDDDYAFIMAAQAKRDRRAAKRRAASRPSQETEST